MKVEKSGLHEIQLRITVRVIVNNFQILTNQMRQEIINMYEEATPSEKIAMINLMSAVDPPNGSKYEAVNK